MRGEGCAARSWKTRDAGRPGVVVGDNRDQRAWRAERGGDVLPTELVFFHQIYQSQMRPFATRKTRYLPPESTVPAMPDYRRGRGAGGGKMVGADKGKLGLTPLARLVSSRPRRTDRISLHPPTTSLLRSVFKNIWLQTGKIFSKSPKHPQARRDSIITQSLPSSSRASAPLQWLSQQEAGSSSTQQSASSISSSGQGCASCPVVWTLFCTKTSFRSVRRHAETSSRSQWRVRFRSPTSLPLLIIPSKAITMGSYSTGRYRFLLFSG